LETIQNLKGGSTNVSKFDYTVEIIAHLNEEP